MDLPTKPAFVMNASGWDPAHLAHPMMRFIKAHTDAFEAAPHTPSPNFYRPDFIYSRSNGHQFIGPAAAGEAMRKTYGLFESFYHEPTYGVITETEDGAGWVMIGYAKLFANLKRGEASVDQDAATAEDAQGRKWDCVAHASFIFEAVRDDDGVEGLRFRSSRNFIDPSVFLKEAARRGVKLG